MGGLSLDIFVIALEKFTLEEMKYLKCKECGGVEVVIHFTPTSNPEVVCTNCHACEYLEEK